MLKRTSAGAARSSAGARSSGDGDQSAACLVPEGYGQAHVNKIAINPQSSDDLVTKLRAAYSQLFEPSCDYEDELLAQIRADLRRDDEVDDALRELDNAAPSATSKVGKQYENKKTMKQKAATATTNFSAPLVEPPSKFITLAKSIATVSAVSRLLMV